MEYRNTNVAKFIAFALIASVCIDTVIAAPVIAEESSTNASLRPKNTKNPLHRKRGNQKLMGKKSLERMKSLFDDEAVEEWKNPCNSIEWSPNYPSGQNYNKSYDDFKLSVKSLNSSLALMNKINTTDIQSWEKFNNESYSYLPTRPTGMVLKWHEHTQIYVASFSILYKLQLKDDISYNNLTISQELKVLRDRARELLCDIEHFVNATSNRNGKQKPYWFEKEEMAKIVALKKKSPNYLNNLFVKARFEHYIDRLYKRIKHFNLEKNLEHKALKSRRPTTTLRSRRLRKNRKTTTVDYTGEPTTTEKTFIITTRKVRKNTKTPRHPKKHNRKNQSLH